MILGLSHVVLGSGAVDDDVAFLSQIGYSPVFVERSLPTAPAKRKYMSADSPAQSLAFCKPQAGLPLELIAYGPMLRPGSSPCHAVVPVSLADPFPPVAPSAPLAAAWESSVGGSLRAVAADRFEAVLYWSEPARHAHVLVQVGDLETATRFFEQGLNCAATDRGQGWQLCANRAVMPQWRASFLLVESDPDTDPPALDRSGFRCVSFVCSDLALDRETLFRAGAAGSTGMFDVTINGKSLRLEVFEGPNGLLIEAMQVARSIGA